MKLQIKDKRRETKDKKRRKKKMKGEGQKIKDKRWKIKDKRQKNSRFTWLGVKFYQLFESGVENQGIYIENLTAPENFDNFDKFDNLTIRQFDNLTI